MPDYERARTHAVQAATGDFQRSSHMMRDRDPQMADDGFGLLRNIADDRLAFERSPRRGAPLSKLDTELGQSSISRVLHRDRLIEPVPGWRGDGVCQHGAGRPALTSVGVAFDAASGDVVNAPTSNRTAPFTTAAAARLRSVS